MSKSPYQDKYLLMEVFSQNRDVIDCSYALLYLPADRIADLHRAYFTKFRDLLTYSKDALQYFVLSDHSPRFVEDNGTVEEAIDQYRSGDTDTPESIICDNLDETILNLSMHATITKDEFEFFDGLFDGGCLREQTVRTSFIHLYLDQNGLHWEMAPKHADFILETACIDWKDLLDG